MAVHSNLLQDLPQEHVSAFETFSKLCDEQGLLAPRPGLVDNEVPDGLNDETTLLRYLRARKFDPDAALKQLQEGITTHDGNNVNTLYNEIDVPEFEATRFLYPHWTGRRAKDGRPLCLFDMAHLDRSRVADYSKTRTTNGGPETETGVSAIQGASVAMDYITRFVFPLCTALKDRPNPTKPISDGLFLVDVSSFTMRQAWGLKNYVHDTSHLAMTGYPEIIDRVYVVNAPSYFGMIWSLLTRWLDPVTASKVVILPRSKQLETLKERIDLESIPAQFGGGFEWEHGKALDIDKDIAEGLEWEGEKTLPPGPMKWVLDETGRKTAVAVGSVDGVAKTETIARARLEESIVAVSVGPDLEKTVEMANGSQGVEVAAN